MLIMITADDSGDELRRLGHWLLDDDDVVRSAEVSIRPSGQPGQMGGLEVIDVVISNAVGLASLAIAYASWRNSRRQHLSVTFTRDDGLEVTVRSGSPADIQKLSDLLSKPYESHDIDQGTSNDRV
ncbi:hypothetical protein GCM10011608_59970 [Micromonospora sonchi]|uniref:Uncharacterized protein n=1 Tax=Micromonospora sonchi TaxID=1763543 RepID=A0A917X4R6_9ACTN|nr:hypothetical protein GCM10011608_59970 [Micromonospora sonchi]